MSKKKPTFSCYLIGRDNLVIQCAEFLLRSKHQILGVFSSSQQVKKWSDANNIPFATNISNAELTAKYDYLFSIVNDEILPKSIINSPQKFAINFHDSLLPKYAGVHATSWAILNNESKHGITWHIIDTGIDTGDILKKISLDVEPDETALTLNIKCYEAAYSSFKRLINEIVSGTCKRTIQNHSRRNYFGLHQKPPGNGWIDWTKPATDIDKLVRALEFGQYANNFSLPKFLIGQNVCIAKELKVLNCTSGKPAGTIIDITSEGIQITTQTQDIILTKYFINNTLENQTQGVSKKSRLNIGQKLPSPNAKVYLEFNNLSSSLSKHESFWIKAINELVPTSFSSMPLVSANYANRQFHKIKDISLTNALKTTSTQNIPMSSETLFTICLIYLARINNQHSVSVGIGNTEILTKYKHFPFIQKILPFSINLEKSSFSDTLKYVQIKLTKMFGHMTYLTDLNLRHSQIQDNLYPTISIIFTNKAEQYLKHIKSNMVISIAADGSLIQVWIRPRLQSKNLNLVLQNIQHHLISLLNSAHKEPKKDIWMLSYLSQNEIQDILVTRNQTTTSYPKHKTIHQIFEEQVIKTPQKIAIEYKETKLSFAELNEKANQVAHYISKKNLLLETNIGVVFERTPNFIIAILGILKSGSAYVPIDPDYPDSRIEYILQNSRTALILTEEENSYRLHKLFHPEKIISIDREWPFIIESNKKNMSLNVSSIKRSYIMYTSGSTGNPKGIEIFHRNVIRLVKQTNYIHINDSDIMAHLSSITFDAATFEIWGALLNGARLVILPKDVVLSPSLLKKQFHKHSISTLWLTSALFDHLIDTTPSLVDGIKNLLVGGDIVSPHTIKKLIRRKHKPINIINGYGPTENTTFTTTYRIDSTTNLENTIPIGKPISNTKVFVLDKNQQLLPVGMVGELYIGGDGLGSYINQPELISEKFISNPFNSGEKLYKSGDLVRWLPDGNLEYIGRVDYQVKIRGFRIELQEIENILISYSGIENAVVIIPKNSPIKQLVTFIVLSKHYRSYDKTLIKLNIVHYLKTKLPDYMIPQLIHVIDEFPITTNGKIDRRNLELCSENHIEKKELVLPQNNQQTILINIWKQIFKKEISIHDDFFNLGGDSIVAMQIASKATHMGFPMMVKHIFKHQTIEKLSKINFSNKQKGLPEGKDSNSQTIPLTPIQHWFFENNFIKKEQFSHACIVELPKNIDFLLLEICLDILIQHYDAFHLRYKHIDNEWKQFLSKDQTSAAIIEMIHIDKALNKTAWHRIISDIQNCFHLNNGPLFAIKLINIAKGRAAYMLMVGHHLLIDGVSWRIFLSHLERIYHEGGTDKNEKSMSAPTSFQDWAKSISGYAQKVSLDQYANYWAKLNRNSFKLPFDYPNKINLEKDSRVISAVVSTSETQSLLENIKTHYKLQIHEVLLSIIVKVFSIYCKSECVLINLERHGREDLAASINVENSIGWFTNLFPAYFIHKKDLPLTQYLLSIKDQLDIANQSSIYHGILHYLKNEKLECSPDISFNYWGQFDSIFSISNHFNLLSLRLVSNPENTRISLINIESSIMNGQLHVSIEYNKKTHKKETIQNLLNSSVELLTQISFIHVHDEPVNTTSFAIKSKSSPLIPMQKGLLFHSINSPGSEAYAVQLMWNLTADINIPILHASFQALLNQFDVLRTYFEWKSLAEPVQHIAENLEIPWHEYDWSINSDAQKDINQRLEMFLKLDRQANFSLTHPPLMRVTLIKFTNNRYKIVFTVHHILIDGWSVATLMENLGQIYQSLNSSQAIRLEPPASLSSYIDWLANQNWSRIKKKWKNYLSQLISPTDLFCLKHTNTASPIDYSQYTVEFSKKTFSTIMQFCSGNQLTLSTILQSIWGLLLSYYNQSNDVVFGVTVSIRPKDLKDAESLVGPLINTIPLRLRLDSNISFIQFFKNTQINFHKINEWADLPLSEIQSTSSLENNSDLFNTLLVVENYPSNKISGLNIDFGAIEITDPTHYPLVITAFLQQKLILRFGYDVNRVESTHLKSITKHFQYILDNLWHLSGTLISELNLITDKEKQKMVNWNATDHEFDFSKPVQKLFEKQVIKTPNKTAIIFNEKHLTYQELNEKSNQVAHYLNSNHIKNGDLIALCIERSLEMVIGMLAIIKLGAAYVPIDPNYPHARIQYMLKDSSPSFILTNSHINKKFSTTFSSSRLLLLDDIHLFSEHSKKNITPEVQIDSLMYVIYTSGSTGNPKGVMIEHRSVINFLYSMQKNLHLNHQDHWLAITPISFDISTLEIYFPLITGAKCVISDQETISDGKKLRALLESQAISVLQATPMTWKILLEAGWRNKEKINILCGGEPLTLNLCKKLFAISNQITNLYGPTETTIWSTMHLISRKDLEYPIIPIGIPISNTQIYILDKNMHCTPIGVIGELYIGGKGLARGYLNQPELTNKKFILNPFTPNQKLYKTEDLARWLPNGELEYIGRTDDQVKIRGFRIELGEIQACIEKYAEIKQAVVIISSNSLEDPELVACLIPNNKNSFDIFALQKFLKNNIPSHMVPTKFIIFDEFPLTPNHKIDKNSLGRSLWEKEATNTHVITSPPESIEEKAIAEIWSKILRIPINKIARDSNFFELGGHSLTALQALSEIYQKFHIELEVKTLFEHQTIAQLAEIITSLFQDKSALLAATKQSTDHNSCMICLKATGNKPPLFLIHPVGGTVFWYISLAKYFDENRPLYAIQDPGISALEIPFDNIPQMAKHYINLIKQIQPKGPYHIGGASAGSNISHEIAYQLMQLGEKIDFLCLLDGWAHYPKILKNREIFESIMMRQYNIMEEKFSTKGINTSEKLFNLQWQRSQISNSYIPNRINIPLTLFKSEQTLPIFKYMDDTFNHWKPYSSKPIKRYIVPGDHETMFAEPNVFILAQLLNESINDE